MEKIPKRSAAGLEKAISTWVQDLAPEGICITDDQLKIQVWNSWLEIASGLSKQSVLGKKLPVVFPELESRRLSTYFQKALAGEVSVLSAAFHKHLFAFPSPLREAGFPKMLQTARIAPLMRDGKIIGTITTIEDVTEREYRTGILRKQHERQELFSWALGHLLQSTTPELMVKEIFPRISAHIEVDVYANYLVEPDGKLHLHSAGGLSPEIQQTFQIIDFGQTLAGICALERKTLVKCDIQQSSDAKLQPAREAGLQTFVCHPLLADSKLIGTLSFASRRRKQFDGDEIEFTRIVAQYIAIALDRSRTLHELHETRQALGHYAGSLESKVSERTAELEQTLKALESFSYTLAHDIRAPLRHIRGFADALHEDCGPELSNKSRGYVNSILRSIEKLDALTHDILAYGQLSQERSPKVVVDLEALLHEMISHNPNLQKPGAVTILKPLHNPFAERFLLEQSLANLLDNALKFVAPDVAPRITISTEAKEDFVRITIEDNGIGVPPEFQHKIFGIFERLPTKENYQGTGIGLAIVAKATHQMNGRLGVESLPAGGSRFWLELPAA
jgi:PAS domain S-box-containing protein